MNIGLVIEHFDPARGFAEKLAVWLAHELVRRGCEVHVVCHDVAVRVGRYRAATLRASFDPERSRRGHPGAAEFDTLPPDPLPRGLHLHRLRGMRLHTGLGFRLFGVRARRWFREHPVDVVHSFSVACPGDIYQASAGVYAAMQAQAAASRHTDAAAAWKRVLLRLPGKHRTLLTLERHALDGRRSAATVIAASRMMAREFATFYPAAAKKVTILDIPQLPSAAPAHSPPETPAHARAWLRGHYGLHPDDPVALFVGHDFRREGLRYAIEAVAKTARWRLLVVGQGRVREYVELAETQASSPAPSRAEFKLQLAPAKPRILFIGPTNEMPTLYAAADALILPTFYEPVGLVAMEALSAGLPVISTLHLGLCETIVSHRAGAIVDSPRNIDALARALEDLPAPGTAAHHALQSAARHAGQGISPESYLHALEALYTKIAHPHPVSRT